MWAGEGEGGVKGRRVEGGLLRRGFEAPLAEGSQTPLALVNVGFKHGKNGLTKMGQNTIWGSGVLLTAPFPVMARFNVALVFVTCDTGSLFACEKDVDMDTRHIVLE